MQYFPLFYDLNNEPVLVVGGGEVACRKVDALLRAGAAVTIVSPKVDAFLEGLIHEDKCAWIQRFYSPELMESHYVQVWATTDNPELNHQVHKDAKAKRIMVNVVDDKPYCDFITPSMIDRGRIQIAISSGGASPVLVRNIREKLEAVMPQNLSLLAEFGASKRSDIIKKLPSVDERRKFWERFFDDPSMDLVNERNALEARYQALLNASDEATASCTWIEYGDNVELLPLKALRLMQQAELVLYHKSCPFSFVDLVRRDAERLEFSDEVALVSLLEKGQMEGQRICIFVPPKASAYRLLIGDDTHLRLATE
ncbi:precorrin-2 dehydrogenase/sirohydrochlorin ferrochelatase family protein [Vibrio sonorensis]|uniref:precorrin-2 dehydrogenase/sirohydrochlorin ferrochelatase family protein n=1 Tax=Vibrio sonorensis TaxID=1004316 RepID=UPI0008D99395|nr:bifunctional precorrin-2 dehydrogenase/sirohydrochlorin ferrochelatase [Vibrio sonorensis]